MSRESTRQAARPRTPPPGGRSSERSATRRAVREQPAAKEPRRRPTSKQIHRRRLTALVVGVLLLGGIVVGVRVLLYDSGLFNVETVTVTGAVTIPVADVLAAAAVPTGGPLAEVDAGGVAARVATLPAVASVEVGRSWPHTVAVDVVERVPLAVVVTPSGEALVDKGGVVYAGPAAPNLPRLTFGAVGPGDPATLAALAALGDLPDAVRPQVRTIDAHTGAEGAPSQVTFGLTGDRQVRWGAPERGPDKAAVLVPLLTQPGRVYDVTSPDLATIRR